VLLVVAPRNAFGAWEAVVGECLSNEADGPRSERFVALTGGESTIVETLARGNRRLVISYDQLVRVESAIAELLSLKRVHLVLDESHRMKAGLASRRGAVLLRLAHLAMRRDLLSGTPMPQSSADLSSQLDFLWPGAGLGARIAVGETPNRVLRGLYVRTTKQQLGLEPRKRVPVQVSLTPAHLAFYAVVKDEVRSRASELRRGRSAFALAKARSSVMRLLQCAVNPSDVAVSLLREGEPVNSALLRSVISEGPSARVEAAIELVERLVSERRKVLVWTIFTSTLQLLARRLSHFYPAVIYGQTELGDESDDESRQGQILRFKSDPQCKVMIANPAAASEGMSLHMHCHDAVYVDRSYNATHFLQSIDRIHRLGLPQGTETTIYVMENKLPLGVGSIDASVARRLAKKIRAMEKLLEDPDLHELALDEEETPIALEASIDLRDIDDLIEEIERQGPPALGADSIV
jgi:SNF2 family DNA or RNA helicase